MKILFIAGLLLLSFLSGYAADWNESLAVQAALANNRDLRAARRTLDEAEARLRGAGRLSNPEIEVVVAGGRDFEGRIEIGLTQYFPLTARLRLEKSLSRLELEAARLEVEERERIISSQVRTAFLSLAAAREGQDLRRRQSDTASTTAKSLTTQAREGFVSSLDATQASLEASQLRADGETSRAEAAEAAGKLATLLGLPPSDPLPLKDNLSLPRSLPAARSPDGRPDLRLAAIAITAAEHDLGLARAMRWQDIGIGLFVEGERFRDEPEGIENEALLGMKLSLPLPVWQNGSAAVAAPVPL